MNSTAFTNQVREHLYSFIDLLRSEQVEIYNEFSLQHELGLFLRSGLDAPTRIQFERPVGFFQDWNRGYTKKEIDIAVFSSDHPERVAIELKFPRNGQHPEQMFSACRDVVFLEQLVRGGFSAGFFLMVVEDRLFRDGRDTLGIYPHFRRGEPISGTITKPTGRRDQVLSVSGSYTIEWRSVNERMYYSTLVVESRDQLRR